MNIKHLFLLVTFFLSITLTYGSTLKVSFPALPEVIDSNKVNSVSDYFMLVNISRPLIRYNSSGELEGDLADSWSVKEQYTKYEFTIKKDQKYSNGDNITAHDCVESIRRNINHGKTVHYDYSRLKSIAATGKYTFTLELKSSDPFFIFDLEHPEFHTLHKSDYKAEIDQQKFSITSGNYFVVSRLPSEFKLEKNTFNNPSGVNEIIIHDSIELLKKGEAPTGYDFIWSPLSIKMDLVKKLNASFKAHRPRLSFSFWLSIDETLAPFDNKKNREAVLKFVHFSSKELRDKSVFFSELNQMYLPGGPGRLKRNAAIKIREQGGKVKVSDTIKVLVSHFFPFKSELIEKLGKAGFSKIKLHEYQSFDELNTLRESSKFHIIEANNDFSSIDLRGSLNVSFNPDRRLVTTRDSEVHRLLVQMNQEIVSSKRFRLIQSIGERLLKQALVVPLYSYDSLVFYSDRIDISGLSSVFADVSLCKIALKK